MLFRYHIKDKLLYPLHICIRAENVSSHLVFSILVFRISIYGDASISSITVCILFQLTLQIYRWRHSDSTKERFEQSAGTTLWSGVVTLLFQEVQGVCNYFSPNIAQLSTFGLFVLTRWNVKSNDTTSPYSQTAASSLCSQPRGAQVVDRLIFPLGTKRSRTLGLQMFGQVVKCWFLVQTTK